MELKEFKNIFLETLSNDKSLNISTISINNDTDIVDLGFDSMSTILFITELEKKTNKKLDLDKLEKFDFKISVNNIYQALFN